MPNTIHKSNFYLLTGGPGAGKTSVLKELKYRGYLVIPEAARAIIKQQQAIGGHATHMGNRLAFSQLMLQHSIADYKKHLTDSAPLFFDRGIPDVFSYSQAFCNRNNISQEILEAIQLYRYNLRAFLFPPWPEIYCQDKERQQDFNEAVMTYRAIKSGFTACGYQLIEIPKMSIKERTDFILSQLTY
ncbi:AAA family ATPase [Legionella sp. CNM-1927-20]|uniref:AAA family ATPase n=1 Tax=Legionella sp. CNM-1927-20 TaxID=3422221 RepID=UPI00403AD18D